MAIVLERNPTFSLREQWVRLLRRSRPATLFVALNVVVLAVACATVPCALLIGGGILASYDENWLFLLLGGVLATAAIPLGIRGWKNGHRLLLEVCASLVKNRTPSADADPPPRLTRMEARALREGVDALVALQERLDLARESGDSQPMRAAAEQWRKSSLQIPTRVSLHLVAERVEAVEKLLYAGGAASAPEDVRLFAEIAAVVAADVTEAFNRARLRQPMRQSGAMWPYFFDNLTRQDLRDHGGKPVALRRWFDEYRRTGG